MADVKVIKDRYTADPLYQWDINQVLTIYGLSLPSIPEIHFTNDAMDRAIVRQATMDAAGVISAEIPNSLLQTPSKLKAYVCIYTGDTFQSLYKVEITVKARKKPSDYKLIADPEVYSFNALENALVNALVKLDNTIAEATSAMNTAKTTYEAAKREVDAKIANAIGALPILSVDEIAEICV